jgi:hypothetical protein
MQWPDALAASTGCATTRENSGGEVTRSRTRHAVLLLLVAMFVVGLAAPAIAANSNRPITLTRAQRRAIIRAPHPYLRKECDRPIGVLTAHRTSFGTHRVIVAQADCRNATSGSPLETAAYAWRKGAFRQLYRLDSGRTIARPRVAIEALLFSVHHRRAVIRYGGFTRRDPLCCPSRTYHRTLHLYWRHFTQGPLVRDS